MTRSRPFRRTNWSSGLIFLTLARTFISVPNLPLGQNPIKFDIKRYITIAHRVSGN